MIRMDIRRFAAIAAIAGLVSACSTGPYAEQTAALNSAAAKFRTEVERTSPIGAANATVARAAMLRGLVQGNPPPLPVDCGVLMSEWAGKVASDAITGPAAVSASYKRVKAIRPCGAMGAESGPEPEPLPVVTALEDYLDGLAAIVEAKDTNDVVEASNTLATSLGNLAKVAGAPAPAQAAPGFFAKLAKMALAQAQYAALRKYVLDVDPLMNAAAPQLITALRVQQSYWASEVAANAAIGVTFINHTLADRRLRKHVALSLSVYDRASPLLEEFAQQQAASRVDPGAAVRSLVDAHHKLAQALRSNRGQLQVVAANVADIASGAEELFGAKASNP